jgi:hypothetical protein
MFDIKNLPIPALPQSTAQLATKKPKLTIMQPKIMATKTSTAQIYSLKDFDEVPRDQWEKIPARRFIRYSRADTGVLVRGGFIAGYIMIAGRPGISLMSNITGRKNDGCVVWTVAFSDIKSIYLKQVAA